MTALQATGRMGASWVAFGLIGFFLLMGLLGAFPVKLTAVLVILFALLFLRQPVVLLLATGTAFIHLYYAKNSSVEFLIQDMWFTVDREVLLAIPMFILAGALMTRGSIAQRMINVMVALTSFIPGGLAISAVLACALFAAISGSSIVTMLAIGTIMYPAMIKAGYNRAFSIGLICCSGTLGIMIPPSISMILYGIVTETSISRLFIAGIGPGLLLTLLLSVYCYLMNRKRATEAFSLQRLIKATREGFFAMMLPVILMGGIYSGHFSPTEAAAVSLGYATIIEAFVHRELKLRDYGQITFETVKMLGTLLPLLAIATSLNTILDYEGIAKTWVNYVQTTITDPGLLLLGINILLLAVGCLMDVGSAIMIFSPLLYPMIKSAGIDPVHFGIIMTANLEIGYLTPPVGLNLIVAMAAFKESFGFICKAVIPFIAIMLTWLAIVCLWPALSLHLAG